jgi:hypothetical protein
LGRMGPHGAAWGRMGRMGIDLKDPRPPPPGRSALGGAPTRHVLRAKGRATTKAPTWFAEPLTGVLRPAAKREREERTGL